MCTRAVSPAPGGGGGTMRRRWAHTFRSGHTTVVWAYHRKHGAIAWRRAKAQRTSKRCPWPCGPQRMARQGSRPRRRRDHSLEAPSTLWNQGTPVPAEAHSRGGAGQGRLLHCRRQMLQTCSVMLRSWTLAAQDHAGDQPKGENTMDWYSLSMSSLLHTPATSA